jgi:hypothetical protein
MLQQVRENIVTHLWQRYCHELSQAHIIQQALQQKAIHPLVLDHFAIIDLPGPETGIPHLTHLFTTLGYVEQGKDYLADKQNDFFWLAPPESESLLAHDVLPQVVVADFRLAEMPPAVRHIIEKYVQQAPRYPRALIQNLAEQTAFGDEIAAQQLTNLVLHYLQGREWPLPSMKEFYTVQEFNELLAWVLVFGRKPNHFTLSIHLLSPFSNLATFLDFIAQELLLPLNREGGLIKGSAAQGIAQAATQGLCKAISIADGEVSLARGFVEFAWRYPRNSITEPRLWKDFFTGFVASHADRVIESLYGAELSTRL